MGDCCIPIIIVCGSRSFIKRKEARGEQQAALLKEVYFCHSCRCHRRAAIFKRNDWFTLCFIPLFPCRLGRPYLGCDACKRPLDVADIGKECENCGVVNNSRNRFCQSCGHDQRIQQ